MSKTLLSKISKLEKELADLKMEIGKTAKSAKPKGIDKCESKEALYEFSVSELKEYIKKKKINVKKITEKHKADFVEIVWKYINDSDDSEEEEEEEESEDEYEWYYY
jgi:hypothetical protein